jgi:hypothetical protein
MNLWRWLGLFIFVVGVTCLVGTKPAAYAQDKDKKTESKKTDDKKTEKKTEEKKTEAKTEKKTEEKKTEAKAGSTKLEFTAFDKKEPFYQEIETKTNQTMKVMGQEVVQKQDQTFYVKWTPEGKDKDGNWKVKQQIVGVKMNIDIGGNKISFDSTDPKQPKNPMTDFFTTLMKQDLTFTINPAKMEVVNIEGREAFIKSLSETNPAINALLNTILSKDALTRMAEPTWWAIPDKAVSKGDTWTKKSKLELGPIGTYNTDFTFTFEGADGGKAKIKIDPKMTYEAPKEKQGLPFVIKKADLQSKGGSGEAIFDTKKGRFDSTKINMKLGGTLEIEVGNMATEITLEQDQTSNVRTTDTDPIKGSEKK